MFYHWAASFPDPPKLTPAASLTLSGSCSLCVLCPLALRWFSIWHVFPVLSFCFFPIFQRFNSNKHLLFFIFFQHGMEVPMWFHCTLLEGSHYNPVSSASLDWRLSHTHLCVYYAFYLDKLRPTGDIRNLMNKCPPSSFLIGFNYYEPWPSIISDFNYHWSMCSIHAVFVWGCWHDCGWYLYTKTKTPS